MPIDYTDGSTVRTVAALPLLARTATPNQQQVNLAPRGAGQGSLAVVINMTAVTATGAVTFKVEGVDPATGAVYPILTSAALAAVAVTVLRVHPNLPPVTNLTAQDMVPPTIRITATHGNAVSMTYSATVLLND